MSQSKFAFVWRLIGWALVVSVIVTSLLPHVPSPDFEQGDKLEHVTAYFMLMSWFAQIDRETNARLRWLIGLVIMGVGLEFLQGWMDLGRMFDPFDMLGNATGALLGWCAAPPRGPALYARLEKRLA